MTVTMPEVKLPEPGEDGAKLRQLRKEREYSPDIELSSRAECHRKSPSLNGQWSLYASDDADLDDFAAKYIEVADNHIIDCEIVLERVMFALCWLKADAFPAYPSDTRDSLIEDILAVVEHTDLQRQQVEREIARADAERAEETQARTSAEGTPADKAEHVSPVNRDSK